jgi:hypothetical protein
MENYLHTDAIRAAHPEVNVTFGDFDDVPALVAKAVHDASGSETAWEDLDDERRGKKESRAKSWLNHSAVAEMTPELLSESDPNGDIRGWLAEIREIVNQ